MIYLHDYDVASAISRGMIAFDPFSIIAVSPGFTDGKKTETWSIVWTGPGMSFSIQGSVEEIAAFVQGWKLVPILPNDKLVMELKPAVKISKKRVKR